MPFDNVQHLAATRLGPPQALLAPARVQSVKCRNLMKIHVLWLVVVSVLIASVAALAVYGSHRFTKEVLYAEFLSSTVTQSQFDDMLFSQLERKDYDEARMNLQIKTKINMESCESYLNIIKSGHFTNFTQRSIEEYQQYLDAHLTSSAMRTPALPRLRRVAER